MKRVALCSMLAAAVIACQDSQLPTPPGETGQVSFEIFDGAHNGNAFFLFLPPLAPNPDNSQFIAPFDDDVLPTVEICPLTNELVCEDGDPNDPNETIRKIEDRILPADFDNAANHFHAAWDTRGVRRNKLYRIIVLIGSTATGKQVVAELGYRDIFIGTSSECGDETHPVLCVNPNTTVQIKFWIGVGAPCFDANSPNFLDPRCATGTLANNAQQFLIQDEATVIAGPGTVFEGDQVALKFEAIPPPCIGFGIPGTAEFDALDLASYPPCYRVTTYPNLVLPEDSSAEDVILQELLTYVVCYEHEGRLINETDVEKSHPRLFRGKEEVNAQGIREVVDVQVLETVVVPANDLQCEGANPGLVLGFLKDLVRRVTAPFAPTPLYARANATVFRDWGLSGSGGASIVGVAMPGFFEGIGDTDPDGVVDKGVVQPGELIDVGVIAKDWAGDRVMLADVTFTPPAGSEFNGVAGPVELTTLPSFTGDPASPDPSNGTAGGQWVITGGPGEYFMTVEGFGYTKAPTLTGDDVDEPGDEGAFDIMPERNDESQPFTVTFKATVIDLFFDPDPPVNGKVEVGETFWVTVCVGADVAGVPITLSAINNNGQPTDLVVVGDEDPPNTVETGPNGCATVEVFVTKAGAIRIVAESGGDVEISSKINIKPAK